VLERGRKWVCRCDCGTICEKPPYMVTFSPEISSCGCIIREAREHERAKWQEQATQRQEDEQRRKAELTAHRVKLRQHRHEFRGTYTSWTGMHSRCYDAYCPSYKHYGARGIQVCERWHRRNKDGFANFAADMGKRPLGYSIERVSVNGNYTPHNCEWIPLRQQGCNTRATSRTATRKIVLKIRQGVTMHHAS
jgi:hypothetical protein